MLESDERYAARDYENRKLFNELFPNAQSPYGDNLSTADRNDFEAYKSRAIEDLRSNFGDVSYWDNDRR